ncbi:RTA1 like protein-domain-containing protein [Truncatella angustata]|uniref:RTA1 like protein-domain-containing protein n=1 Tax=Truncatella angustata TaxID=152316 RepID=A0A9P8UPJ1_9PEZI|nr:RTA1 like protein-domain-containing protein [Truncatella angustata]KAH6655872.1 RTA1 like protein-domain-containing protein [Truncatella angustata]
MAELKPYRGNYYLWQYLPSTAAAGLFAALFILGTGYITWRLVKARAYYCVVFVIGGIFEIVGYCARAASRNQTDVLGPYVIQSTLLLVAPALFAASIYVVLGRVIRAVHAERLSFIPVKWLTTIFVCGDVASFMVQASGAGIMVTGDSPKTGENIILGGLIIQIIMFGLFATVAGAFHIRHRWWPTGAFLKNRSSWTNIMVMLYTVSIFIMVRSIFRVIEYAMGQSGYLLKHEWTLYVFDATLMFGVVAMFSWRFPSGLSIKELQEVEVDGRQFSEQPEESREPDGLQMSKLATSYTPFNESK